MPYKTLRLKIPFLGVALIFSGGMGITPTATADDDHRTMPEVLAATTAEDWRTPDDNHVLYLELESGRIVIELAPQFAPEHVANIRTLVRQRYFDELSILRAQENYVVQWGDPNAAKQADAKPIGRAKRALPPEFATGRLDLNFTRLASPDAYADEVGFVDGFPSARNGAAGSTWLAHCYGMIGAGRDVAPDSGSGAELYVVIGHAPRHLDRNVTLVGRVLQGMELLTTLPRGTGDLGFYASPSEHTKILTVRVAADVDAQQRTALQVLRTDTGAFRRLIESRRFRREPWFADDVGRVGLCNVPLPVRKVSAQ